MNSISYIFILKKNWIQFCIVFKFPVFMCQYSVFYGEYENEKKMVQKNLTFPMGIWTPDFWTSSRPQFEFWGR